MLLQPHICAGQEGSFTHMQKRHLRLLFVRGMYFESISETRRLMKYAENGRAAGDYRYFISACYYLGGQYRSVVRSTGEPAGFRSRLLLSQAYRQAGMYDRGLAALGNLKYEGLSPHDSYELFIRRSELMLYDYRYEEIFAQAAQARSVIADRNALESFISDLNCYSEIKTRSPLLSASLSALIPGAGQIYSGRWGHGLLSFISVALPAAASIYFYRNGRRGLSGSMMFFSAVFYTGNIYGAARSAEYAGMAAKTEFRDRLIRQHVPSYEPVGKELKRRIF